MKDKRLVILISIIVLSVCLLSLTIFLFIKDERQDTTSKSLTAYGVVVEKGSNYLLVEGVDDKRYYVVSTDDSIDTGTFVSVSYKNEKNKEAGIGVIDIVLNNDEITIVDDIKTTEVASLDEVEKATTEKATTTKKTTKMTTTSEAPTTKVEGTTQYRYTTKFNENDIVTFASDTYQEIKNDKKPLESAKEAFITLVDFIFYDGEIKGKKFNELTSSAKAKVVYYTLLIDAGIDAKWPNYKDNIQNKYQDIKSKLLAKYMDLTTTICESSGDNCAQAKSDFALLKESVKLTWNTLKTAFSYAYNKGKTSIVEWYEIFSGKR